jgi:hypothetical protein
MPFGGVYTARSQGELRTFTFDFFGDLSPGDSLVSATSTLMCADDPAANALLVGSPVIANGNGAYIGSSFQGYISNNLFFATTVPTVPLVPLALVTGGTVAYGTYIIKQLSGTTGGIGVYQVSVAQSVPLGTLNSSYRNNTVVSQQIGANSNNLTGFLSGVVYEWEITAITASWDTVIWTVHIPGLLEPE